MGPWKPLSLGSYIKKLPSRTLESLKAELWEIQDAMKVIKWRRHGYAYDLMEFCDIKNKQSLLIITIQECESEQNKKMGDELDSALNAIYKSLAKMEAFINKPQHDKKREKVDYMQEEIERDVEPSTKDKESKNKVQELSDEILLEHEKSIEEDKPSCEQEGSDEAEAKESKEQPCYEIISESMTIEDALIVVVQVHDQHVGEDQVQIVEEIQLIVSTTSVQVFKMKAVEVYYEVYLLPSPCEMIWIHCSRLFVMTILPYFKIRGRVFF